MQLSTLDERCDMASLCIVVRTTPTNTTNPHYFIDADVRAFIETTFNTTAEEFAVLFESFMVGRVRGKTFPSDVHFPTTLTCPLTAVAQTSTAQKLAGKAEIRSIVRDTLRKSCFYLNPPRYNITQVQSPPTPPSICPGRDTKSESSTCIQFASKTDPKVSRSTRTACHRGMCVLYWPRWGIRCANGWRWNRTSCANVRRTCSVGLRQAS